MKQEIKQFGKTILSSDYSGPGGLELFFANMTGKNKCGWEYWAFVENWVLQQGFELGPVDTKEDPQAFVTVYNVSSMRYQPKL